MTCVKTLLAAAALATATAGAALATSNAPAPSAQSADPAALLRESLLAAQTVSYVGQIETVRFSSNRAVATIVKIEHRAPDETRRWFVAPEAIYGDYVIARGDETYQFDTKHDKVTVSRRPEMEDQVALSGNFETVLDNYRALDDGTETVADRHTISVVLINRYTGERAMRVWIDEATNLVLKKEEYHANGAVAAQMRFENIRYTASIPADLFSTTTPAGYTQVAGPAAAAPSIDLDRAIKDAGFAPYRPRDLPQGFKIVGAVVSEQSGVRTLHLLYSDGLRSVSLFENAANAAADFGATRPKTTHFEGHSADYVEDGPTTLLTWREHNRAFALVGDLLLPELVAIARSVVP